MNIGDYVRTYDGIIEKIYKVYDDIIHIEPYFDELGGVETTIIDIEDVIKSSPNIIDLIEVGDYVNGYKVIDISYYGVPNSKTLLELDEWLGNGYKKIANEDIKSIVTKEMFANAEYRVETN